MEINFLNWIKREKPKIDYKDIDLFSEEIWDENQVKKKPKKDYRDCNHRKASHFHINAPAYCPDCEHFIDESKDLDPYKEENWNEKLPCKNHKWGKVQVEHLIAKDIYYVQCEICGEKRRVHAGYLD